MTDDNVTDLVAPIFKAAIACVAATIALVTLAGGAWWPVLALWLWVCRTRVTSRRET